VFIQQHNKWPEEDRFKREQAKQKKKAEKDKQMKLKSFKKDKESWSMDADEKLEQLAQIERDKQEAVDQNTQYADNFVNIFQSKIQTQI
jgi:hypothetical protein